MRAHGNMTGVEKQMNKDDLRAWKNYDNNQYSLIPGVTAQKKILDRSAIGLNGTLDNSMSQGNLGSSMTKAKSEAKY